jgi:hypothetical protein
MLGFVDVGWLKSSACSATVARRSAKLSLVSCAGHAGRAASLLMWTLGAWLAGNMAQQSQLGLGSPGFQPLSNKRHPGYLGGENGDIGTDLFPCMFREEHHWYIYIGYKVSGRLCFDIVTVPCPSDPILRCSPLTNASTASCPHSITKPTPLERPGSSWFFLSTPP